MNATIREVLDLGERRIPEGMTGSMQMVNMTLEEIRVEGCEADGLHDERDPHARATKMMHPLLWRSGAIRPPLKGILIGHEIREM